MFKRFTVIVEESLYAEEVEAGSLVAGKAVGSLARAPRVAVGMRGRGGATRAGLVAQIVGAQNHQNRRVSHRSKRRKAKVAKTVADAGLRMLILVSSTGN